MAENSQISAQNAASTLTADTNANSNANLDTPKNQRSPYYVDPSECPTMVLVAPPLSETNYYSWARSMRRALILKNKFQIVDGSIPIPSVSDPNFKARERCNALVHCWIRNSTSPTIAQSVLFIDHAVDVWTDLRERFEGGDMVRVLEFQRQIDVVKQGTRSVIDYFNELQTLWGELEQCRPIPNCTCAIRCSCESMRNEKLYKQQEYVIRFLNGLNEQFTGLRSQILSMDTLPPLKRVLWMIIQHERQQGYGISSRSFGRGRGENIQRGRGRSNQMSGKGKF